MTKSVPLPARARTPLPAEDYGEGRFPAGSLLAERYRILGRLGKGGMGEVYRATDLRLGQTVALKFLPEAMTRDPGVLARFYNEVRVARQVTHPNVCRAFDIGEVDGQPFLSMQFVDGEDLSSLLRRIGRLPADKAVEIARKLCAGLAAAHSQNVLHRDLKPANIMLDGRGQVIITDFGLAGIAEDISALDIKSGTPDYMSPEQLAGREVTVRSDIYALGLVLYEVFTGHRAFEAKTLADLIRLREESRPAGISSVVKDIDPAVERIIEKCLDPDPAGRPSSALAVSAALPGGDPLAAALAAGETPSPEMVASAGSKEALRPGIALSLLAAVLILLIAFPLFRKNDSLVERLDLELPPDALIAGARQIIRTFGYTAIPADRAWDFATNEDANDFASYRLAHPGIKADWSPAGLKRVSPLIFWYRQSPNPMTNFDIDNIGQIQATMPPETISGMVRVRMDLAGHLLSLIAVPPQLNPSQFDKSATAAQAPNPAALFAAADLDFAGFRPATPLWAAPVASDLRLAWTAPFPGSPGQELRVETAWWNNKPVWFHVVTPWAVPHRMPAPQTTSYSIATIWSVSRGLLFLIAACVLAWRNLRLGRGDRSGAWRLATFIFLLCLADTLLGAHDLFSRHGLGILDTAMAASLLRAARLWLVYIALEPAVRRRWPRILISWSRIATGKWKDPMVGRDILAGILAGLSYAVVNIGIARLVILRGGAPESGSTSSLLGSLAAINGALDVVLNGIEYGLVMFMILFVLRLVLRREWLAGLAFALLFGIGQGAANDYPDIVIPASILVYGAIVFVVLRYGMLSMVLAIVTVNMMTSFVVTTNFSAWYGTGSLIALLIVAALAVFAFRQSLGQQRLLSGWLES